MTKSKFNDPAGRVASAQVKSALLPHLAHAQTIREGEQYAVSILVDKDIATYLLGSNPDNRRLNKSKLMQYVADMREGRWDNNGEPIILSRNGEINDGQHRLQAICETDIPQMLLIGFGYSRDSRDTIDIGAPKNAGAHINMYGYARGNSISAATRHILAFENTGRSSLGADNAISAPVIVKRALADPKIAEAVEFTEAHRLINCTGSVLSFVYYELAKQSPELAREFVERLSSGVGLSSNSPIYCARERLVRKKLPKTEVAEILLRAWNGFVTGQTFTRILTTGQLPVIKRPSLFTPGVTDTAVIRQKVPA